jgi:hypothetical protein
MPLAFKYCVGKGIELGAASHNPFDLPDCLFVGTCNGRDYLFPQDLNDYAGYKAEQERQGEKPLEIDMLGDFQDIDAGDRSFDYIVSSHVIEHVPNLFGAYAESSRVLKNGGVFMCIFPKRTSEPTDGIRALTTLEQMIDAWDRKVDMHKMPLEGWRGHYQVFSLQSMIRAINHINRAGLGTWLIECVEETDSKVGNGHTVVLRKFEQLPEMQSHDASGSGGILHRLIANGELATALSMTKAALSYDFFDPVKLYIAALLSCELGDVHEGLEFLRQALVADPENERYRKDFVALTGRSYTNPVQ